LQPSIFFSDNKYNNNNNHSRRKRDRGFRGNGYMIMDLEEAESWSSRISRRGPGSRFVVGFGA